MKRTLSKYYQRKTLLTRRRCGHILRARRCLLPSPTRAQLILSLLALAQITPASEMPGKPSRQPEYKLKAGYLYNFAYFIEWPAHAAPTCTKPVVIGAMGSSNAVSTIEGTLRNKRSKGRSFLVKAVPGADAASDCHMLFVTREVAQTPVEIRRTLGSAATLLVGETDQFVDSGGMIGFVPQGDTFRFTLNREAAAQAELKVSSQLAYVALAVEPRH